METYLLVDGYNIINSWPELLRLMEDSIDHARDRLIHLLNNHAGFKECKIILIFDGHKVKDNRGQRYFENGLEIVFSPWAVTADQLIEKEVGRLLKEGKCVYVATSDKLQQEIIWTKGAYRVSARELLEDVERARQDYKEIFKRKNPVRRNYLEANLDGRVREELERIRRS